MPRESIKFGVVPGTFGSDPRESAVRSRAAGFAGLQFDSRTSNLDLTDLSTSGRREFRRLLSSQDQQLIGLRSDLGPKGLGPGADVDRALARLDAVMEAAAGLLAPLVCVELGPLPEPPRRAKPKPKVTPGLAGLILLPDIAAASEPPEDAEPSRPDPSYGPFVAQVDAALADLGRRADRYNVTVGLRSELASFAALERCLRASNCPWFGIDLDPVALLRDESPADDIFSSLGTALRHVRGRDAVRGADRRTKPAVVGQGSTDWEELLSNLDAAGYRGWITVDPIELPDRPAAAGAALSHLQKLTGTRST